ncbi:unnamed protein product [Cochlearia groenlandica]
MRTCFDDEALVWYRWERDQNPFENRDSMMVRVLKEYSEVHEEYLGEMVLSRSGQTSNGKDREKVFLSDNHKGLTFGKDTTQTTWVHKGVYDIGLELVVELVHAPQQPTTDD